MTSLKEPLRTHYMRNGESSERFRRERRMHKRTKRILLLTFESDESELEEITGPDAGAIEPYMYEPVASESEETDESDQDAEEERRENTDW